MKLFKNKVRFYILILCILVFLSIFIQNKLLQNVHITGKNNKNYIEQIRNFKIDDSVLEKITIQSDSFNYDTKNDTENNTAAYMTSLFLTHHYNIREKDVVKVNINEVKKSYPKEFELISAICKPVVDDIKVFPVPKSKSNDYFVNYVNSWGASRSYGGKRTHEGTDLMADFNQRGIYPVISMTDGIVEDIGWLELGGYRMGIRSNNGGYFYYAHLSNYADGIKKGDKISAGQIIGMMGDTGYSKAEGTVGNFDVHLHVGIYISYKDETYSINPYYILRNLRITTASY